MSTIPAVLVLAVAAVLYFLPSLIAQHRGHHQLLAIFALNLLAGWTALGWLGAFVWACTAVRVAAEPQPRALPPDVRVPTPVPRAAPSPSDDEIPVYEIPESPRRPKR